MSNSDKYESYETFKQMMIILYDFSMAVNQNINEKEVLPPQWVE